jgi:hypothetical protein
MIADVAARRSATRPPEAVLTRERRLHVEQARGHRFVAGWGPKRSATVVPAPLRYGQYHLPGPAALALTVVVVAVWLGLFGWGGGWAAVRDELPVALAAGLVVLLLNVSRTTVTDHGLSTDLAGTRVAPGRVTALVEVREVRAGRPPGDWPAAKRRGGWMPGRTRVAVRHLAADGTTEQAFTAWVRDPEAFAEALGAPLR